jgi:hypothetical protein
MTKTKHVAPIALFVYNRPWHASQTVEALKRNALAEQSDLFIFSDAPKRPDCADGVRQVRDYIDTISGFKSINVIKRAQNFGLAKSIIDGATYLSDRCGRFIVLEDDIVTSPYFLAYMNEGLERYVDDDRVISIHGYVYPVTQPVPEAFFLVGADCLGWATWRRGWALFDPDGQHLLDELKHRRLIRSFDFNGAYPYARMLEGQIKGINDSWAVRWYASAFLAGKMTLYPGRSLVHTIGEDGSGTNGGNSNRLDVVLSDSPIDLNSIKIEPSRVAWLAFEEFFRQGKSGLLRRFLGKVRIFSKLEHR